MTFRRVPVILLAALLAASPAEARAQSTLSWGRMQEELERREHGAPEDVLRIPYGEAPEQFGELSLPGGDGPHPLAVLVHGGCWLSIAGVDYLRPLARELNRAGWAVWSLEFRRIDQPGGEWPGILEDVARGADFARTLAARHDLDLSRTVVMGHSSGGHLALWLARRSALPEDEPDGPRLRGEDPLSFSGAVGLAAVAELEDFRSYPRCGATIVDDLLGEPSPERMARTNPAELPWTGTPELLLMGALDPIVPPAHGLAYEESAPRGVAVEVVTVPEAGHFELVAPWTDPWPRIWLRLEAFLDSLARPD